MRKDGTIRLRSGRLFSPLDPDPRLINIEDIAHALSNICRFTGHTREFYSVAQHSVLVAQGMLPGLELWGLLHDAAEAYLCDVARPIKHLRLMEPYREVEKRLQLVIYERFGLSGPEPADVKRLDRQVAQAEIRDLIYKGRQEEPITEPYLLRTIGPLEPREACYRFMDAFNWRVRHPTGCPAPWRQAA